MNGLGVYDFIIKEHYDPSTGETYEALTARNNPAMAERCKVRTANRCVWCIKATADFNSNSATLFRSGIKNGNINLLLSEVDAENVVKQISGYKGLSKESKDMLILPYFQTTMLINEMINLEHNIVGNKVQLKERSGMRKDRWSSVEYSYAITQELSKEMKPEKEILSYMDMGFHVRAPKKVTNY